MKKLRVVVVSSGLAPQFGGAAVSEASLCAFLSQHADVTVLCRGDAVDGEFVQGFGLNGVVRYHPAEIYEAWKNKAEWIHKLLDAADVLHLNGHWRWENYFFARLCKRKGVPYVLHPRGMLLVGHRKTLLKYVFNLLIGNWIVRHASKVIALSQYETRHFDGYGLPARAVQIIPNGIPVGAKKEVVLPANIHLPEKYFLYYGRVEKRKNLVFLVNAFAEYVKAGGSAHLLIMGPVERGYDRTIKAAADVKDVAFRVHLLAPQYDDTRWELVRRSLAVVYPALEEPFGRVPFEAVAVGTVPIIPDRSGSAEYLKWHIPSAIYKQEDAHSLSAALLRAEKGSIEGASAAQEWVKNALDWKHISRAVLDLYREVGAGSA
ncbi:MAG: glycosyltransferase family 4 protein [Bdellovibrionota bacterium]